MPSMSPEWQDPWPGIVFDKTTDEFGEPRYGWFCEPCGEGGFELDPDTAHLAAREHMGSPSHFEKGNR